MGNDIKLPASRETQLLQSQRAVESETRAHITLEIDRISNKVDTIHNQIELVEYNIKQINRSIDYYKGVITHISKTLHQVDMDQINEQLNDERFMEAARAHLEELERFNQDCETAPFLDEYDAANIANLENSVDVLNNDVTANEDVINKKFTEFSQQ